MVKGITQMFPFFKNKTRANGLEQSSLTLLGVKLEVSIMAIFYHRKVSAV
ncbi:MAG: hypothetical protein ACJA0C_001117 [Candidatus Endobugula sp.]|jgi:hypothetical protein